MTKDRTFDFSATELIVPGEMVIQKGGSSDTSETEKVTATKFDEAA